MSNYFGTGLDQAPLNEQLGEAAYWDLKQLYDVMFKAPVTVSSAYTARNWETVRVDTRSSSVTVTLPANPQVNDRIQFADAFGTWHINRPMINRNGKKIMGLDQDLELNLKGENFTLAYSGDTDGWVILG